MSLETTRWDGSEYLDNPESMRMHIEDAMTEGDPALMALVLGNVAKSIGMTLISRQTGLDRAVLYKALVSDGRRETAALTEALRIVKDRLEADPSVFNEAAE
jgi:probable addiction module antidote protein